MPKFNSDTFRSKHDPTVMHLANILQDAIRTGEVVPYFMTLTFDRYGDRYLTDSSNSATPVKGDVLSGLTRRMPPSAALDLRHADIRRFYIRLCRTLFGRSWAAMASLQPRGIGWMDRPAYKGVSERSALARHPGDVFEHAHIGFIVTTAARPGRETSVQERFEELCDRNALGEIWRRFNAQGEVHIDRMWDPYGALDYSAKTAKKEDRFSEYMIILPCQ